MPAPSARQVSWLLQCIPCPRCVTVALPLDRLVAHIRLVHPAYYADADPICLPSWTRRDRPGAQR